ncbi:MAG: ABC transporter permease [Bacteroidales bacterium]|nr:ABC transporter permease [Bacteroidales bacterium]
MDASLFISRRLRFKGKIAMTSIAVSFLVMIIAVAVSSGFRHSIRDGISSVSGDIQLLPLNMNLLDDASPVESDASYLPYIYKVDGVEDVVPVIYRAGIVRQNEEIHGVLLKGMPSGQLPFSNPDSLSLAVSIPRRLSDIIGLNEGDKMLTYFIGDKVRARQFNVVSVYDAMLETDDRLVVYADLADLQRLNGWNSNQVSAMEIMLEADSREEAKIAEITEEVGVALYAYTAEDETTVLASSCISRYPQIFDWLNLMDFNVLFILVLMTIVAGFNMISGLLIMLFENISTIGLLKTLGMTDRSIAKVFLSSSAVLTIKGMAIGNALAIIFCVIQSSTHILKLDPVNYFVPYVPVQMNLGLILTADIIAFAAIMLFLLIPCIFISKVDPAETVRVR